MGGAGFKPRSLLLGRVRGQSADFPTASALPDLECLPSCAAFAGTSVAANGALLIAVQVSRDPSLDDPGGAPFLRYPLTRASANL